jgi:riboflavin synthase
MFTGIVEKSVAVLAVHDLANGRRLAIASDWTDVRMGESIAVNGCCLTVSVIVPGGLAFDIVPETLAKTNLGSIHPGDKVHVERSLRVGDRLDGHFVQGHIDATASLIDRVMTPAECRLTVRPPAELMKYVTPKGSVTLDGVSLTIAAVRNQEFEVALIPTTLALTQLGQRPIGWPLNIEADILTKTVISHLERRGT